MQGSVIKPSVGILRKGFSTTCLRLAIGYPSHGGRGQLLWRGRTGVPRDPHPASFLSSTTGLVRTRRPDAGRGERERWLYRRTHSASTATGSSRSRNTRGRSVAGAVATAARRPPTPGPTSTSTVPTAGDAAATPTSRFVAWWDDRETVLAPIRRRFVDTRTAWFRSVGLERGTGSVGAERRSG